MLHSISIENFYSIAERQELNFRVPANAPDLHCFSDSQPGPDYRLPSVVGIYGPNASGKSTVLRALTATVAFVQNSFGLPPQNAIPFFNPFANHEGMNRPTKVIVEYDGRLVDKGPVFVFRYEVHIANDPKKFAKEVIFESLSYAPQGKSRRVFERNGQEFHFGREFGLTENDPRIKSIRPNASISSTLAQLNHDLSIRFLTSLNMLQTNIAGLDRNNFGLQSLSFYLQRPDYFKRLNRELGRLDLGLEEMKLFPGNAGLVASFKHTGLDSEIMYGQESAGTRKFIGLFQILQSVLEYGGLAIIDELDTDIHPLLISEIFHWFYSKERNPEGAQLLFTAHNPAILDELEKEQIFFCEKLLGRATHVYGAREIKGLRRGPSMMKKYLSGELGAVPHVG